MHEVATMQRIIQTILTTLLPPDASQVTKVQLVLGASQHFTEETARQHFQAFTKGTLLEGATLVISWLPATFQCLACFHRFPSDHSGTQVLCPLCGELALEVEHQDLCSITSIDVLSPHAQHEQVYEDGGSLL